MLSCHVPGPHSGRCSHRGGCLDVAAAPAPVRKARVGRMSLTPLACHLFGAARAIAHGVRLLRRRSQRKSARLPFLLSTAVRDARRSQLRRALTPRSSLLKFPAGGSAAYDKAMATADGRRRVRWPLWLAAGVLFGLAIGFAFGLSRPRVRN